MYDDEIVDIKLSKDGSIDKLKVRKKLISMIFILIAQDLEEHC